MCRSVILLIASVLSLGLSPRIGFTTPPPTASELEYVLAIRDAFEAYERGEIARVRAELANIRALRLEGALGRFEFRLLEQRSSPQWRCSAPEAERTLHGEEAEVPSDPYWVWPTREALEVKRSTDGKVIAVIPRESPLGADEELETCCFEAIASRNGETILLGDGRNHGWVDLALLLRPQEEPDVQPLKYPMQLVAANVSPDGRQVAMAHYSKGVSTLTQDDWRAPKLVGVHSDPRSIAVDDGGLVAVGCYDGSVVLLRTAGVAELPPIEARFFALDHEVTRVEFIGADSVEAEDIREHKVRFRLDGVANRVLPEHPLTGANGGDVVRFGSAREQGDFVAAFRHDGERFGGSTVWSTARGRRLSEADSATFEESAATRLERSAISPDGRTIARSCEDGVVELIDVRTGRRLGFLDASGPIGAPLRNDVPIEYPSLGGWTFVADDVHGLAFHPDGATLVAATAWAFLRWTLLTPPDAPRTPPDAP